MSRTTWLIELSTGDSWLSGPMRPSVASTPVIASSSGTPAATSVPNASTSRSSVIGSEVVVAFFRSPSKTSMMASSELAEPNCSMLKPGCARWSAAVPATVASTISFW